MSNEEKRQKVSEWSLHVTAEDHKFDLKDYYWTKPVKGLLYDLTHCGRQPILFGIMGLQGTGKSAALRALIESFPQENIIFYKWRRNWEKDFFDEVTSWDEYFERVWLTAADNPEIRIKLGIGDRITMKYELDAWKNASDEKLSEQINEFTGEHLTRKQARKAMLDKMADLETLEKILGDKIVQSIKRGFMAGYIFKAKAVFIDMPDYNKTNLQLMNKDVEELQHMWDDFVRTYKLPLLISVQKEIIVKKPHFFFGKVLWTHLQPLTHEQLLGAYVQKWGNYEPFTKEALGLIAKLSRGVFRRFLKYINLTIKASLKDLISVEDVEKVISSDVLLSDMELELSDFFPNLQHRIQAVKVFEILRNSTLSQKQIAENLGISEAVTGKLIAKLELYGYVKRVRKQEGYAVTLA